MTSSRRYAGRVSYRHDTRGETGREWFSVTVGANGERTLRAECQMDDERLQRDVVYTVDADWRPLDAYVRLAVDGRQTGSAMFRFDANGATCSGVNAADGAFRQRVDLPRHPTLFAPHPVVSDAWQAAAWPVGRPPGRIRLEHCTNSSSRPDGGSGPRLEVVYKDLEYVGQGRCETPVGGFTAEHFRIHPVMGAMAAWPPLELWVTPRDRLLLRLRWELLQSTYELVELDGDAG